MNFYSTWAETRALGISDTAFICAFIDSMPISQDVLLKGSPRDVEIALSTINSIPMIEFVHAVKHNNIDKELTPADIPCFSTFTNGIIRINELLEFAENGLTYAEIGYQITNTPNLLAQIKYGENQAKLASTMSLVSITTPHRPAKVLPTSLGHYLVAYSLEQKESILRKLLLRDPCIQLLVKQAYSGGANYRTVVKCLSDSTAYRRRTSVKCAVEFALGDETTKMILKNIVWEV